jgi:hypothetical protein
VCLLEFDEAEQERGKKGDSKGVGLSVVSFVGDDLGIWSVKRDSALRLVCSPVNWDYCNLM